MALDADRYLEIQDQIMLISSFILALDGNQLQELLTDAEHSESFGCFVDPTRWRESIDKIQLVIVHARAIKEAKIKMQKAMEDYAAKHPFEPRKTDG